MQARRCEYETSMTHEGEGLASSLEQQAEEAAHVQQPIAHAVEWCGRSIEVASDKLRARLVACGCMTDPETSSAQEQPPLLVAPQGAPQAEQRKCEQRYAKRLSCDAQRPPVEQTRVSVFFAASSTLDQRPRASFL